MSISIHLYLRKTVYLIIRDPFVSYSESMQKVLEAVKEFQTLSKKISMMKF